MSELLLNNRTTAWDTEVGTRMIDIVVHEDFEYFSVIVRKNFPAFKSKPLFQCIALSKVETRCINNVASQKFTPFLRPNFTTGQGKGQGGVRTPTFTEVEGGEVMDTEIRHMRRVGRLLSDIAGVIESGDYTYKEAIQAMDDLKKHYEKQSRNLMDSTSIQKVATFGGELS